MMHKIKPDLDIILDVLKQTLAFYPTSKFMESLLFQYQERGGLSKKQLEGLLDKATKVSTIPPGKLATIQAIILKKPTRDKSPLTSIAPVSTHDFVLENLIKEILTKYPHHKRVLFIQLKMNNNEPISSLEKAEIERFHKLLMK